ncbi:MAG: GTPase HflX, partial [Candidatus Margulisbacteria bacterium]|nr:GTPase HflX [Candidatus Margulisiibacteriota bacterium]
GRTTQSREHPHPGYYLGNGKAKELKDTLPDTIHIIISDDELSPLQQKNLEKMFGEIKILDRTSLILDIFAKRATTSEAKCQIELAQLEYLKPRLTRLWTHLSRLGGGIGTKGPGEKQLEVDKRQIESRISTLKKSIKTIKRHRNTQREKRRQIPMLTAALVGYTNAGKSTLMNTLTNAQVVSKNQLFSTLDPITRRIKLPSHDELLITDTVGFIQKLPHQLVSAFHATLESIKEADFLLHLVDASHPKCLDMLDTSLSLLKELDSDHKPQLLILNKIDVASNIAYLENSLSKSFQTVSISALNNLHIDNLYTKIDTFLSTFSKKMTFHIPYNRMDMVNVLYSKGKVCEESYDEKIKLTVNINRILGEKILGSLYESPKE